MKWRTGFIFGLLMVSFAAVLIRIGLLITDEQIQTVGSTQGARSVSASVVRGTIYDRNGEKLVNNEYRYVAVLMPEQRLLSAIRSALSTSEYQQLLDRAKERLPMSVFLEQSVAETDGLLCFHVPDRYSYSGCTHLIGYLDGSQQYGIYGIEGAFDSVLSECTGEITVTFPVNGAGDRIQQTDIKVTDTTDNSRGGVKLTIDKTVQQVVDEVCDTAINKGAVVVLDTSGEVLAMSSRPDFDPEAVEQVLEDVDSPLINRCLSKYDCGSVFKIITAAAALEHGVSEYQGYVCDGELAVDTTLFHCHNRQGHGLVSMEEAFAQSCNLYFIQLAQAIGGARILSMAEKMGLSEEIVLAEGLSAQPAILPSSEDLNSAAALANLSFGQGELLISPLHIARMTTVFTANGTLPQIRAVIGTVTPDGILSEVAVGAGETVLSAANTRILCRMLEQVVQSGTGSAAQPLYTTAAGKTGTAETGQLDENGVPVTQSWFTGYYPAENPRYVVTVLVEDAGNSNFTAAQVFCEISNKLEQKRRNGD